MGDESGGHWAPMAALPDPPEGGPAMQVGCDGETFEVRADGLGGTHYAWLSGPNPGYGFTSSPAVADVAQHEENIRSFLSMIDPETGYIAED